MLPFRAGAPASRIALRRAAPGDPGTQQHIDRLANAAIQRGAASWRRAFEPVLEVVRQAQSLEELKDRLESEEGAAELLMLMDTTDVEELLQRTMLLADLEGRVMEDG